MRRSRNTDWGCRVTWTPSHIPVIGCVNTDPAKTKETYTDPAKTGFFSVWRQPLEGGKEEEKRREKEKEKRRKRRKREKNAPEGRVEQKNGARRAPRHKNPGIKTVS